MHKLAFGKIRLKYGKWKVISSPFRKLKRSFVMCRCVCGVTREVDLDHLRGGDSTSCGCSKGKTRTDEKHGLSRTGTYRSWKAMKDRCLNPRHCDFHLYGGRGILICDEWKTSFSKFLNDMGTRPANRTLDRYPNKNGNYELGNCRWATRKEQNRNSSQNHVVGGKTVVEWRELFGVHNRTAMA